MLMRCPTPSPLVVLLLLPFGEERFFRATLYCCCVFVKIEALSPGLLGKEGKEMQDSRKKARTAFAANYCGGTT